MPLNPACEGKAYPSDTIRVREDSIAHFIRTLQEDNPHYVDPKHRGGVIAPPLYPACLALPALDRALGDPALGVAPAELLPIGCEFQLARPVRPGRDIVLSASFGKITADARGETIPLRLQGTRRLGVLVFIAELQLLHPSPPDDDAPDAVVPPPPATHFLRPPLAFRAHYRAVAPSRLLDGAAAESPPLPRDHILGACLGLGYAARTVVDTSLKRDPSQLKRIRARPVRPIEPDEPLTVAGWIVETRRGTTFMGFEILDENGGLVTAEGLAEVVLK